MPFISLDYTLTDASGVNKSGQLTAQSDYIEAGYEIANLSRLLDQIFIYQYSEDSFTVTDINFNKDFIIGVFDVSGGNYQGFAVIEQVNKVKTEIDAYIDNNSLSPLSTTASSSIATIKFNKNQTNTGVGSTPLDYFDELSKFINNDDTKLNLKGYAKATLANNTISFKSTHLINIVKPQNNASYISLN